MLNNINEDLIACFIEIKSDAITLNFFVGCFLSLSLSIQSLTKYIEDERKQNDINAFRETINTCRSKEKSKNGAKNTNKFLVH